MNKTMGLYLFICGMILWAIVCGIIWWKFYQWRRRKFVGNLSDIERKRWQRLEKARVSRGGYKKGFAIIIAAMLIPWIIMFIFHMPLRTVMLFWALLFIPIVMPHIWFVFKRKNSDEIIMAIFLFGILAGMILWGLGYKLGYYFGEIIFFIFIFYWLLFKMKGEQEQMTIYNNLVVTAGMDIDSQMNGYSQRPYSRESDVLNNELKNLNFNKTGNKFGKIMGKEMLFMDWKVDKDTAIFYPVTANLLIMQIYTIFPSLGKDKISWIKLKDDGRITVFVSKGDYDRILEEVTYHTLCKIIAERFEQSFIEFAKGTDESKINSIKMLRGDENE